MLKKKRKKLNPAQVIIPAGHPNPPEPHEVDAAWILAHHYQCSVEFLIPVDDYLRQTADIVMLGVVWEIKSPIGDSKSTISNQFNAAKKKSRNIVLDSRRTSLDYDTIEKRVRHEVKMRTRTKRVLLIDKQKKVVEIKA